VTHIDQFRRAMESSGVLPPEKIFDDGALHRFRTNEKATDLAGWYVLHADGIPAGSFGDFRLGVSHTFRADIERKLTQRELREQRERLKAIRKQRATEEIRRHAEAAELAKQIWNVAGTCADHPYLARKSVKAYGVRIYRGNLTIRDMKCDGALLVPLRVSGKLKTLEFIDAQGDKRFLPGGAKAGAYHAIGKPNGTLVVCEGYATGASVHEATGYAVAVAFDAGNLTAVAKAMRRKFPRSHLIIAGDNDASQTGQKAAAEAAKVARAKVAIPIRPGMDWNDMAVAEGLSSIKREVTP
jgi:putative DNA primase/helicase